MKCPVCQAKLLPVDGELFCLQCGHVVALNNFVDDDKLTLEETTDPLLQRAISDANDGITKFNTLSSINLGNETAGNKQSENSRKHTHSFKAMRDALATTKPVLTGNTLALSIPVSMVGKQSEPNATSANLTAVPTVKKEYQERQEQGVRVIVNTQATSAPSLPTKVLSLSSMRRFRIGLTASRYLAFGVAILAIFVTANVEASNYYASRVLPGVHVGNIAVGGWTYDQLKARLPGALPAPSLSAVADGRTYSMALYGVAITTDYAAVEREIEQSGRNRMFPAFGLIASWLKPSVRPSFSLSDTIVDVAVKRLADEIDRTPSNAAITVVGSNVFVLADKPGRVIDKEGASAAIRAAYGHADTVSISPKLLHATVQTNDFDNDVTKAQATIGQNVVLIIHKAHYSPSAAQIASWIEFQGVGKGITLNPVQVEGYIASLPGAFDRVSALNGLISALNGGPAATIAISNRSTVLPPLTPMHAAPVATYNYCLSSSSQQQSTLSTALTETLKDGGWTLGGKILFVPTTNNCNVKIAVGPSIYLSSLDFACQKQTTCRIHDDLAISSDSWSTPPAGWVSGISTYRGELINQVFGQWLGFDHPSCNKAKLQSAVLATPTINVPGCSPIWYPVPAEVQDTKVLAGF